MQQMMPNGSRKAQKTVSDRKSIPGGVGGFEARRFGSIFGILWGAIVHQKSEKRHPKKYPGKFIFGTLKFLWDPLGRL